MMQPNDTLRQQAGSIAISVAEALSETLKSDVAGDTGVIGHRPWMRRTADTEDQPRLLSLTEGYPALALIFAELAAHDAAWQKPMRAALKAMLPHLRSSPMVGLYDGAMSAAFVFDMAARATGGYQNALKTVHGSIVEFLRRQSESGEVRRLAKSRALTVSDYDLISGLSGAIGYLLLRPTNNADLLVLLLQDLVTLARVENGRPRWTAAGTPSYKEDPADFPNGHVNVGIAHGAAGILSALSLAARAGVVVPRQESAMETLSDWLLECQVAERRLTTWPPYLVSGGTRVLVRLRGGWCYGIPGIARALQLAGLTLGNQRWLGEATSAMRSMHVQGGAHDAAQDPGLCHGWAGSTHVAWRFSTDNRDDAIQSWIDAAAAATVAHYVPDSDFGFRSPAGSDGGSWTEDGGFLTGAAGIALVLHRYSHAAPPLIPWDRVLLAA